MKREGPNVPGKSRRPSDTRLNRLQTLRVLHKLSALAFIVWIARGGSSNLESVSLVRQRDRFLKLLRPRSELCTQSRVGCGRYGGLEPALSRASIERLMATYDADGTPRIGVTSHVTQAARGCDIGDVSTKAGSGTIQCHVVSRWGQIRIVVIAVCPCDETPARCGLSACFSHQPRTLLGSFTTRPR